MIEKLAQYAHDSWSGYIYLRIVYLMKMALLQA